jgi:hypothetical protein
MRRFAGMQVNGPLRDGALGLRYLGDTYSSPASETAENRFNPPCLSGEVAACAQQQQAIYDTARVALDPPAQLAKVVMSRRSSAMSYRTSFGRI